VTDSGVSNSASSRVRWGLFEQERGISGHLAKRLDYADLIRVVCGLLESCRLVLLCMIGDLAVSRR
jgi:hypothetical protein